MGEGLKRANAAAKATRNKTEPRKTQKTMNGDELCACGHVADEHNPKTGTCEIDECVCCCFEEEGELEEDRLE